MKAKILLGMLAAALPLGLFALSRKKPRSIYSYEDDCNDDFYTPDEGEDDADELDSLFSPAEYPVFVRIQNDCLYDETDGTATIIRPGACYTLKPGHIYDLCFFLPGALRMAQREPSFYINSALPSSLGSKQGHEVVGGFYLMVQEHPALTGRMQHFTLQAGAEAIAIKPDQGGDYTIYCPDHFMDGFTIGLDTATTKGAYIGGLEPDQFVCMATRFSVEKLS